jgi:hypothetical protein
LFKTESNASNIESWLVRDIIEYLSGFFPFPVKAVWEPSFGGNNKISLSSELVKEDEDGNINESVLSENKSKENAVKKILKEETDHLRMMLRRLPSKTVRKMDEEFDSSLNYISKMFIKTYKSDPRKLSEHEFTRMVIIDLMSLLDVRNHLPNDVEWYDDVLNGLSKHYKERISSMYNVLKK